MSKVGNFGQIPNVCLTFEKGGFIQVVNEKLTANWNGHQFAKSAACNLLKLQLNKLKEMSRKQHLLDTRKS